MKKKSLEENRKIIIDFIKSNPKTTYKEIRKKIRLHPERVFKNLKEAFREAGIEPPRTFDIKTKEKKREIIINYIKKHPNVGGQTIKKDTKINISNVFDSIKDAYKLAEVNYPRKIDKRTRKEKIKQIVELVNENNLISILEITNRLRLNPYRFFRNFHEIYKKAGIKEIKGNKKRAIKKRIEVIDFIRQNPLSTQREINSKCNTHVQNLFDKGIFEAYEEAEIEFPYERLKLYGVGIKEIRDRAKNFESEIAIKLSGYGKVNRLVKTKRGFADIIFERKNKKAIIEIKNYQSKEISITQIKQLNKYMEDIGCNLGFLICNIKPKRDNFLIGKNRIFVLSEEELSQLPMLMNGSVV